MSSRCPAWGEGRKEGGREVRRKGRRKEGRRKRRRRRRSLLRTVHARGEIPEGEKKGRMGDSA